MTINELVKAIKDDLAKVEENLEQMQSDQIPKESKQEEKQ